MSELTAIDCQGFAGGFTLGVAQTGFRLVGKREMKGGFGVPNCEVNRHLLGHDWVAEAVDPEEWTPYKVDLVFGNPPCSGFSTLSPKAFRGIDSTINECMWAFSNFAARCQPTVAIFESVSGAFKTGRPLMQNLRENLETKTGLRYQLHHVLHNAVSVGGSAIRKRYFWVVSQVPFAVDPPNLARIPSLASVIGDLDGLPYTWSAQPYRQGGTWWSRSRRREDGVVDGHWWWNSSYVRKSLDLVPVAGPWKPGERLQQLMVRHYDLVGDLPDSWESRKPTLMKIKPGEDKPRFWCGASQLTRWHWDKPARVITGAGMESVLHPLYDRPLSHREVARIMGFPDDWVVWPFQFMRAGVRSTWGKGIPVDCGRWISGWAKRAIEGDPGKDPGEEIGEREFLIDVTNDYREAVVV